MSKQVLLVEDNPMDARLIQDALTGDQKEYPGYKFKHVTSLREAKDCVASGMADIVLLDLSLPDSQDIGSVNELSAASSAALPIVVLTGRDDEQAALQALKYGAQDYLLKNRLDLNSLDRTLDYAIERHRLVAQLEMARKEAAALAMCDALTGLPNRRFLEERLTGFIDQSERAGVIFIDLDGFKAINDRYGHNVGDRLLKTIADRLSRCVRQGDLVGRLGGDEFVCLTSNFDSAEESTLIAERIIDTVTKPIQIDILGHTVSVGTSIGIALYPEHGNCMKDLLEKADKAMYQAKQASGNLYRFYNSQ